MTPALVQELQRKAESESSFSLDNKELSELCCTWIFYYDTCLQQQREYREIMHRLSRALGIDPHSTGGPWFEFILGAAEQAHKEAEGLYIWKCRIRKALGVKPGTDCAAEIKCLHETVDSLSSRLAEAHRALDEQRTINDIAHSFLDRAIRAIRRRFL